MRAKYVISAIFGLAGILAGPALAQDNGYGYRFHDEDSNSSPGPAAVVGLRGSFAFASQTNSLVAQGVPARLHAAYDNGGGGSVFIGAYLPYGFRLDLEGMYRYLPAKTVTGSGQMVAANGNSRVAAPMVNLMWNVPLTFGYVQPFIGAGIGAAHVDSNIHAPAGTPGYLQSDYWALAYQAMGGVAIPVGTSSRLTAMYRWFQTSNFSAECGIPGTLLQDCKPSLNSQSVDLGLEMDM